MSQLIVGPVGFRPTIVRSLILRQPVLANLASPATSINNNHLPPSNPLAHLNQPQRITEAGNGKPNKTNGEGDKANPEQLTAVAETLQSLLPKFFTRPHDFSIYTKDIKFVDNIRGIKTIGTSQYLTQVQLIKFYHMLRYTHTRVELLNLVKNPQESCVKIRWRVITRPGLIQHALKFRELAKLENWKDGLSTMYVNREGKIYCHICDNIDTEVNDTSLSSKKTIKNPLVSRGISV